MKEFVIGIDAGGTKTRACAYSLNSNIPVAEVTAGCGNPANGGESAICEIIQAAQELCTSVEGICVFAAVGAAGISARINGESARNLLNNRLRALPGLNHAGIEILPDAELALYANFEPSHDATSAIVISGTGSAVFAFSGELIIRAGGWGNILGDGGSGYHVGLLFLKNLTQLLDSGNHRETLQLQRSLCEAGFLPENDLRGAIVDLVYRQPKSAVAALAPFAAALAETYEPAMHILTESASALADDTERIFRRACHPIKRLTYTGGFLTGCKKFRDLFINELSRRIPDIKILPSVDPTLGAIRLYQRS